MGAGEPAEEADEVGAGGVRCCDFLEERIALAFSSKLFRLLLLLGSAGKISEFARDPPSPATAMLDGDMHVPDTATSLSVISRASKGFFISVLASLCPPSARSTPSSTNACCDDAGLFEDRDVPAAVVEGKEGLVGEMGTSCTSIPVDCSEKSWIVTDTASSKTLSPSSSCEAGGGMHMRRKDTFCIEATAT